MISCRVTQLGGMVNHMHKIFFLDVENNLSPHRMAYISIQNPMIIPLPFEIFQIIDVLFLEKSGNLSAWILLVIDVILCKVHGINIPFGGLLINFTMEHCKLYPVRGKPFLVFSFIISFYRIIKLEH